MLLNTVHIPSIYTELPINSGNAGVNYSLMQTILEQAEENCVILVDDKGLILHDIHDGIKSWDPKFKVRARELMVRLKYRNRFVPTHLSAI